MPRRGVILTTALAGCTHEHVSAVAGQILPTPPAADKFPRGEALVVKKVLRREQVPGEEKVLGRNGDIGAYCRRRARICMSGAVLIILSGKPDKKTGL
jgi:hypothetical protein